jgi:protein-S-isoprenylcysteine O-methyltransferase Ste14
MLTLRSFVALIVPVVVVTLIPILILQNYPPPRPNIILQIPGVLLFSVGLLLAGWCMLLFFNVGRGTIMPWDATRKLVAVGPYQSMRNPMILGVLTMLVGEALFFGSAAIGILAAAFFAINHVYFIFSEEPGLEKRFGESYREYKKRVPRWIPRMPK